MKKVLIVALLALAVSGWAIEKAALAASSHHSGAGQSEMEPGPATREYLKAMDDMHADMMSGIMDPDPDAAFVRGMLPHHRGAVDMARTELKYGKDPELRKLAQDIIEAQEKEIKFMQEWLDKHGR